MKTTVSQRISCLLAATSLLVACAATQVEPPRPGTLRVVYSSFYPDGSMLKEDPKEVRIVTRETTSNQVGRQVGLNVLLLAVGSLAFTGFSKDDLKGADIEGLADRSHLQIPVTTSFVSRLQTRTDTYLQAHASLKNRVFQRPLTVAGGSTRLVYENLLGTAEETFRLKTDVVIYKARENGLVNSVLGPKVVECAAESEEAWPKVRWAENNYQQVQIQLEGMLQACENKTMASLDTMLLEE